jgi:TPR repeat protein
MDWYVPSRIAPPMKGLARTMPDKTTLLTAALCLALCTGCATPPIPPIPQTEYNMGVQAFRIRDYDTARQHWTRAVDAHDLHAYNNLGALLYRGLGGPADAARAVALWTTAAQAGDADSQWHLGQAAEEGQGVARDVIEAYAWYRCALVNAQARPSGDDLHAQIARNADHSLARLAPQLTAAQREAGETLARSRIAAYAQQGAPRPG